MAWIEVVGGGGGAEESKWPEKGVLIRGMNENIPPPLWIHLHEGTKEQKGQQDLYI